MAELGWRPAGLELPCQAWPQPRGVATPHQPLCQGAPTPGGPCLPSPGPGEGVLPGSCQAQAHQQVPTWPPVSAQTAVAFTAGFATRRAVDSADEVSQVTRETGLESHPPATFPGRKGPGPKSGEPGLRLLPPCSAVRFCMAFPSFVVSFLVPLASSLQHGTPSQARPRPCPSLTCSDTPACRVTHSSSPIAGSWALLGL